LGPWLVIFEKPRAKNYKHLKALYLKGCINSQPVNKMLVDTGAAVNIMPYSVLRRLEQSIGDLIKTNVTLSDFNGQTLEAQGVLSVDLTVGNKTAQPLSSSSTARVHTMSYLAGIGSMLTTASLPQCINV
jgi:predicted aspartyl protease